MIVARPRQVDLDIGLDAPRPRRHHDAPARQEDRLLDVVGDEEHRLLVVLPDLQEQLLHQPAGLVVERAEGFVQQQDVRIVGERSGNRHALLHATRQLFGKVLAELRQPGLAEVEVDDLLLPRGGHTFAAQAEGDVVGHRQPREQGVGLEHHAPVRPRPHHLAPRHHHPARGRIVQPRDDAQKGGLAAAGGAEDRHEVVALDGEVDRREGDGGLTAALARKGPRDPFDDNVTHARLHGNMDLLSALNAKSEMRPIRPMTMMPKMICPVLSSAWLSTIM